jgi:7-cyano-7-deazaguanine synthase
MAPLNSDHALVLFSGGQDSAVCLAWALRRYSHVETIGFRYGQRHVIELACRDPVRAALASPRLGPDHIVDLTATIAGLGATALTSEATIAVTEEGLPNTFVPGRNLLFLTCAGALAWRRGIRRIVAGM